MKRQILFMIAIFVLWLFVFALVRRTTAIAEDIVPDEFLSNIQLIEKYGGEQEQILTKVMNCESGGRRDVKGDGGKAHGLYQYHKPTWDRFAKLYGQEMDYYSPLDQIKLTAFVFQKYPEYRNHWTCFTKNKNSV